MHTTAQIVVYVWARWQVAFTVAGMTKWLHRQGFSYKKPTGFLINSMRINSNNLLRPTTP
ncbi:helix-turn-helix domain-containing protein [Xenorhabdus entomophaga]|uniref:helix-turn-helix domain-containing protein n=1 Tax=Xenorhabdus entomophaga TaxID=3136257 RepID=UPI0030F46AB5